MSNDDDDDEIANAQEALAQLGPRARAVLLEQYAAEQADNADQARSRGHASQGNAPGTSYRAEDLGEHPHDKAARINDEVVAAGGSRDAGIAAAINSLLTSKDPRVIVKNETHFGQ